MNSLRGLYTYEGGLLVEFVAQNWDGSWVNSSRDLASYEGGLLVESVRQGWDGSDWVNGSRGLYTYESATPAEAAAPAATAALTAYPNPTAGVLTVALGLGAPARVGLEVYDVLGRRVHVVEPRALPTGETTMALDLGVLPAGTYVVRVTGAASAPERITVVR